MCSSARWPTGSWPSPPVRSMTPISAADEFGAVARSFEDIPTPRRHHVLLEHKNAVVYGAGGSIGGAVSRAFAREGARVFLAGRTSATLETVAEAIRSAGGSAQIAEVDALDEQAVDEHADAVAADAGGIDISFNLITHPFTHGTP